MAKDPVCGKKVGRNTKHFLEYGDKIFYFDCEACKITFQENPDHFLRKESRKGFLGWFTKGNKQVPKSCHEMKE